MTTPLFRQIHGEATPKIVREIDHEFQVEMIAKNSRELLDFEREKFRAQALIAREQLIRQDELIATQRQGNEMLGGIRNELQVANHSLDMILDATRDGFDGVNKNLKIGFETVALCLGSISDHLFEQKMVLLSMSETLQKPSETEARELRDKGEVLMKNGMESIKDSRDQRENWKQAKQLFELCVENPMGGSDRLAWFRLGFLHWKLDGDFENAEECFYQAQRLSAGTWDEWHLKSSRHLAEMRQLRNAHGEALADIECVLEKDQSPVNYFNAARYAAKCGKRSKMKGYLEEAILGKPVVIHEMFQEPDFFEGDEALPELFELLQERTGTARRSVSEIIKNWRTEGERLRDLEKKARISFSLDDLGFEPLTESEVAKLDYLGALEYEQTVLAEIEGRMGLAEKALRDGLNKAINEEEDLRKSVELEKANGKREIDKAEQNLSEIEYRKKNFVGTKFGWAYWGCGFFLIFFVGPVILSVVSLVISLDIIREAQMSGETNVDDINLTAFNLVFLVVLVVYFGLPIFVKKRERSALDNERLKAEQKLKDAIATIEASNRERETEIRGPLSDCVEIRERLEGVLKHLQSVV